MPKERRSNYFRRRRADKTGAGGRGPVNGVVPDGSKEVPTMEDPLIERYPEAQFVVRVEAARI